MSSSVQEERKSLDIPVRDEDGTESEEVIQIYLDDLPPVEDLLGVLKAERADLNLWLKFAVEYFRQDRKNEFENILQEGSSAEVERFYAEEKDARIAILNAFAAYKIDLGKPKPGENKQKKREKSKFLTEALDYLNRADRISNVASKTWVNKGVLQTVRGDLAEAERDFSMALEIDPSSLLALVGLGKVFFANKRWKEAKEQFKTAIRTHPGCSASVRVSLGLCFYELGKLGRAKECFERALYLDNQCVDALVSMAIIELGQASMIDDDFEDEEEEQGDSKRTLVQRALQRLELAYSLEPSNPLVLNHLANHFFLKDKDAEFDRMKSLASSAFKNTELETIKAESSYILGRLFHHRGEYSKAREFYSHSLKFWPDFVLAEYAVAQMEMQQQEKKKEKDAVLNGLNKVIKYLKKVTTQYPNDRDSLLLLGYVKQKLGKRKEALELWKRVTDLFPSDREAWIEQALTLHKLSEKDNPCRTLTTTEKERALRAYAKVRTCTEGEISSDVWCNTGVLKFSIGDYQGALQSFLKGAKINNSNKIVESFKLKEKSGGINSQDDLNEDAAIVTLKYNIGLTLEQLGRIEEAETLYRSVVSKTPEYSDAFLRLGLMSQARGQLNEAEDFFLDASRNDARSLKALLLQGNLKLLKGEKKPAREKFNRVVHKINPHQAYARLRLANIDLELAQTTKDKEQKQRCIQNANGVYEGVLVRRGFNMFAANGIASLIGLRTEHRLQCRRILERLKEVCAIGPVWLNLGHICILDKQYDVAASLYEQCLKRFDVDVPQVLNYISHAYVLSKKPEQAKTPLLKAIKKRPEDLSLWFNLAVSHYASAIQYLARPSEDRNLDGVVKSIDSIEKAKSIFHWLSHAQGVVDKKEASFLEEPSTPEGMPPDDIVEKHILELARANGPKFSTLNPTQSNTSEEDEPSNRRPIADRAAKSTNFLKSEKSRQSYLSCQKSLEKAREIESYHKEKEQRQRLRLDDANKKSKVAELERLRLLEEAEKEKERERDEIRKRALEQQERNKLVAKKLFDEQELSKQANDQKKKRKTKEKVEKVKDKMIDASSDDGNSSSSSSSSSSSDSDNEADKDFSIEDDYKEKKIARPKLKKLKLINKKRSSSSSSSEDSDNEQDDKDKKAQASTATTPQQESTEPRIRKKVLSDDDSDEEEEKKTVETEIKKRKKILSSDDEGEEEKTNGEKKQKAANGEPVVVEQKKSVE